MARSTSRRIARSPNPVETSTQQVRIRTVSDIILSQDEMNPGFTIRTDHALKMFVEIGISRSIHFSKLTQQFSHLKILIPRSHKVDLQAPLKSSFFIPGIPEALLFRVFTCYKECNAGFHGIVFYFPLFAAPLASNSFKFPMLGAAES